MAKNSFYILIVKIDLYQQSLNYLLTNIEKLLIRLPFKASSFKSLPNITNCIPASSLISESTYTILKKYDVFEFKSRGELDAKGKGKIPMYFIDYVD